MIVSEKPHQNLSDYIQTLLKKSKLNKKWVYFQIKNEKFRNHINDYARSFIGKDFESNALYYKHIRLCTRREIDPESGNFKS